MFKIAMIIFNLYMVLVLIGMIKIIITGGYLVKPNPHRRKQLPQKENKEIRDIMLKCILCVLVGSLIASIMLSINMSLQ